MRGIIVMVACAACGARASEDPPPQQAAPMAAIVQSQESAILTVGGRDPFSIVVACDLAPPQVTITRPRVAGHAPVDARLCREVWTAAHAVAIAGDCADTRITRACIETVDHGAHACTCFAPGANPRFDAAVRDFAIAASRAPMKAIDPTPFADDDVVTGELVR